MPDVPEDLGPTEPWPGDDIGPTKPGQEGGGSDNGKPAFWILAKGGYMNGRMYQMDTINHLEITIGRNPGLTIRYPADTAGVSRAHARIYWKGNDLVLLDCGSTSGTFLQRIGKLSPMVPVILKDGDVFYIGEKKNEFEVSSRTTQ